MKIITSLFFTSTLFFSCMKNTVHIYMTNSSKIDDTIALSVTINNEQVINDNFYYTGVSPDYDEYSCEIDKDSFLLKITENEFNIVYEKMFLSGNTNFLYIDYVYDILIDTSGALVEGFNRIENSDTILLAPRHFEVISSKKSILIE